MTKMDWAYIAGLFDGEGCVTVSLVERKTATKSCRVGARALNMSLRIANNDPRVLVWLEENVGGKVRSHSPERYMEYAWIIQGVPAADVAKNLLAYSRMKRDQLELFIALHKTKNSPGVRVDEEVWDLRADLVAQIRSSEYRRSNSGGPRTLRLLTGARP